jgi:hypothetical protein
MGPKPKMIVLHPVHGYRIRPQEDLKTIKRNARERNRVQTVNQGFEHLRLHIPSAACDKKMSKVNILSHAVNYIQCLHAMVQQQHMILGNSSGGGGGGDGGCVPQSPGVSSTSDYFSSAEASFNISVASSSAAGMLSPFVPAEFSSPRPTPFGHNSLATPNSSMSSGNSSCYSPHTPFTPHSPYTPSPHSSSQQQLYTGGVHHLQQQHSHFSFPAVSPMQQIFIPENAGLVDPLLQAGNGNPEEDSSEGEDDILDAIVEWQDHAAI